MKCAGTAVLFVLIAGSQSAWAQSPPPKEPPPLWDLQLGSSFVGTSGNSDTTTLGFDFGAHRRWPGWKIEATAAAVRTTDSGIRTAERYLAAFRGDRKLSTRVDLSAGERAEQDRLAGIDLRSITDVGLKYALVRRSALTVDALTSLAFNHENQILGPDLDHAAAVLQAVGKIVFGPASDSSQRITFYPDLEHGAAYRAEAEVTAQAAMNRRLALKVGYLWRYSNAPAFGFVKSDNTVTASIVLQFKAARPAPPP
jgi:putative salt-induced outer membrane protein YdiY